MRYLIQTSVTAAAILCLPALDLSQAHGQVAASNEVCNPVVASGGEAVLGGQDRAVTHDGSYPCPPVQEVAVVLQVEPAAPPPEPLPEGGVVLFPFDSAALSPDADARLGAILADIRARALQGITVAGHTDTVGSARYNDRLSQRRAESVAAWLEARDVPAQIITTEAYGKSMLAVPTADDVPLEANRRVVIQFAY